MPEPVAARGELARRGYLWRLAETRAFAAARQPAAVLAALPAAGGGPGERAAELAAAEPLERPDPESGAPSWAVPGPGGHVRHYGALASIERAGLDDRRLKREWLFGFLYRALEEAGG